MLEEKKDVQDFNATTSRPTPSRPKSQPEQAQNKTLATPSTIHTQKPKETPSTPQQKRKAGRPPLESKPLPQKLQENIEKFTQAATKTPNSDDLSYKNVILSGKPYKNQGFNVEKFVKVLRVKGFTANLFMDEIGIRRNKFYRWLKRESEPTLTEYFRIAILLKLKYFHDLINMTHIRDGIKSTTPLDHDLAEQAVEFNFDKYSKMPPKSLSFAEPADYMPSTQRVSLLFHKFPLVSGVDFSSFIVTDPSMTETSQDGYHCTFECHVDRLYRHSLSQLYPEIFSEPEKIAREDLIRNSNRQDPYGNDIWKFLTTAEVYPWAWWDIVNGIKILVHELGIGNPSVKEWHTNLAVDDGDGWRTVYYDLFEDDEEVVTPATDSPVTATTISLSQQQALSDFDSAEKEDDSADSPDKDLSAGLFDNDPEEDFDLDIETADERKF